MILGARVGRVALLDRCRQHGFSNRITLSRQRSSSATLPRSYKSFSAKPITHSLGEARHELPDRVRLRNV